MGSWVSHTFCYYGNDICHYKFIKKLLWNQCILKAKTLACTHTHVQWNLHLRDTLGLLVLSITERCPLYRACKNIVKVGDYINGSSQFKCPLKQRRPLYVVSTKWRFHCINSFSECFYMEDKNLMKYLLFIKQNYACVYIMHTNNYYYCFFDSAISICNPHVV